MNKFLLTLAVILPLSSPAAPQFTSNQVSQVHLGMTKESVLKILAEPLIKTNVDYLEIWAWQNARHHEPMFARVFFVSNAVCLVDQTTSKQAKENQLNMQLDARLNREPILRRQAYVFTHPDLDESTKTAVLDGLISTTNAEMDRVTAIEEKERDLARTIALSKARAAADQARTNYADEHVELSPQIRYAILTKRVIIGMTADQVKITWGNPKSVSRTTSATGVYESWSFHGTDTTLSFENGRVAVINELAPQ